MGLYKETIRYNIARWKKIIILYKYSVYILQIQVVLYPKAEMSRSFRLYKGAHKLN